MIKIVEANTKEFIEKAKELIWEYAQSLEFDLGFQDFDKEMENFPGQYTLPGGCLYVALDTNQLIGCVALRDFGQGICEMKRLYVKQISEDKRLENYWPKWSSKPPGIWGIII